MWEFERRLHKIRKLRNDIVILIIGILLSYSAKWTYYSYFIASHHTFWRKHVRNYLFKALLSVYHLGKERKRICIIINTLNFRLFLFSLISNSLQFFNSNLGRGVENFFSWISTRTNKSWGRHIAIFL